MIDKSMYIMKPYKYLVLILFFCSFNMFCAGTHGKIQEYRYSTTKDKLANAVATVIKENDQITLDPVEGHYNDEINYFTLFIRSGKDKYGYVLRYYGDRKYWNESLSAEIFLCYARINGIGGKEGDEQLTDELKEKLLEVLKSQFIDRIDNQLKMTPKIG